MQNEIPIDTFLEKAQMIYDSLCQQPTESLTKKDILKQIEGLEEYYSYIISALASTGKVRKKSGRTGGIDLASAQGMQRELVQANKDKLKQYFTGLDIPKKQTGKSPRLERDFYDQLKIYLDETGLYDIVEIVGGKLPGGKWENPDLVSLRYNRLQFHFGLYPTITAIEVKREFPNITHIQQSASYLNYCHTSYLCFFDDEYRGKDLDTLVSKLRDEGIWELSNVFSIGLIVSFKPQERSPSFSFHTIKEAPKTQIDAVSAEEGIKLWFSQNARAEILKELKEQLKSFI